MQKLLNTILLLCPSMLSPALLIAVVCFGNRAAAYQALGKVVDPIADCSLAVALERGYITIH